MSTAVAVREFLDREAGAMIELLEQFVAIETPSDVPESQQPMLDLLAHSFGEIGYRTTRIPARRQYGGHLYARPARSRTEDTRHWQLLLGHCDTVWKLGTLESMPVIRDGDVLKGPGVYDMKAGLVEIIFALKALEALGFEPVVEPVVFIAARQCLIPRPRGRGARPRGQEGSCGVDRGDDHGWWFAGEDH